MTEYRKTKPSFLEAGLPCASLSAECQRDNNARQRPPQNRLHIWWARRPPTVCRAAILAALLPYDTVLSDEILPESVGEPLLGELDDLPAKLRVHRAFFQRLLDEVGPTQLTNEHNSFLRGLGIKGDSHRAYRRMAAREDYLIGSTPILLPMSWTYRHPPALTVPPSSIVLEALHQKGREMLGLAPDEPLTVLDFMSGGGTIPLEALRHGYKVYANDLNPVASLVLRSTLEYPARFGTSLVPKIEAYAKVVERQVRERLLPFFPTESGATWWSDEEANAAAQFRSANVTKREAASRDSTKNCYLWSRVVPCSKCDLNIPISTNFHVVTKKGKPEASIAAFPEVPSREKGNDCTFRIVKPNEWVECRWPKPDFTHWHPRDTTTFKDGKAICPRCGHVMSGDEVKELARSQEAGLHSQIYAICSKVPVKLTYRNGEEKVRYMWRFRAPTDTDLAAVSAAETELARLLPRWQALGLVPDEEIQEGDKTKEPRNMGLTRWRDLFLARQQLTNGVVLEEIRAVQARVRQELLVEEAEAVNVYLAFILSKVVNYNSVNTFWHYGRKTVAQTFSRHDLAFRPAFCEFEGARETVMWGVNQVVDAYESIAAMIHGGEVLLSGGDEEGGDDEVDESAADEANEENDDAAEVFSPHQAIALRPEIIVPTVTNEDAAALSVPGPGSVHLICVDPPYYNNVQYSELSNFFYVWLKRALADEPGLAHLFREPLAETNREAVANAARWAREAAREQEAWQQRYDQEFHRLRALKVKVTEAKTLATDAAGVKPLSAKDRADRFYEDKMAQVFRRARLLLHSAGRMVVMFNHKETYAWRGSTPYQVRAGFEIRSSVPIHTEAESSLNIRGLDAARSTVLLMCVPREEREQAAGNWATVQSRVAQLARGAAQRFQAQGLSGTDLYLSALGPAIGEVARNWPVTDFAGREVDLEVALNESYRAVGQWRLEQILEELTQKAEFSEAAAGFAASSADRDSQTLWLWLDTFQGETAQSDDVRKLAKSLNVDPDDFKRMGLLEISKDLFILRPPSETDLKLLSRRLAGADLPRGRAAREADVWEERVFPGFHVAAVWNAIALMGGVEDVAARGPEAVRRWLNASGYGSQREFFGAFTVTLDLLEHIFGKRSTGPWHETVCQARRAWDLVLKNWQI